MAWIELSIAFVIFLFGLHFWSTLTFDFWKLRNVAGPKPSVFFGNLKNWFLGRLSFAEVVQIIYEQHRDEPVIGIYMGREPALVLVDFDLIKNVLVKDFVKFPDRVARTSTEAEPLSQNLIKLEAARWRPLRHKLSPAFASGNLKKMFYLLLECGDRLEEYFEKFNSNNDSVECCELTAKFTTDVIGACVFGLRTNALANEESEFRKMGRAVFNPSWKNFLRMRFRESVPWLYSILAPFIADSTVTDFFTNIMKETINYRKINKIVKNDFIDLIAQLRDHPDQLGDIELTDSLLTAQLCVFFLAGFETSSTAMSNALYELALHQSIQAKLRSEINSELAKNDGELSYEVVKSMKYLDMVLKETLRKYPPASTLIRRSKEVYTFPGTDLTIPKGTQIVVPVFSIHRDSSIYPNPEEFDPERFTEEAINARHSMSWLAFGAGPRNCIGARFASQQSKVGLIKILQKHRVEICEKTQIPYVVNPRSVLLAPANGIHVKVSKID